MGIPAPNKVPMVETSGASFPSNNVEANSSHKKNHSSAQVAVQTLPARIHPMKHFPPSMASTGNQLQLPTPSSMHVVSTRSISAQLINHNAVRHQLHVASTPPIGQSSTVKQTSSAAASYGRSYINSEMKLLIHTETPPAVNAQTCTSWDAPRSQPAWDTPSTTWKLLQLP